MAPLEDGRGTHNQKMVNAAPEEVRGWRRAQRVPVDHLSLALAGDHVQQRLPEVVSDAAVAHDLIPEDDEPEVVDVLNIILLHIHTILWTETRENARITPARASSNSVLLHNRNLDLP